MVDYTMYATTVLLTHFNILHFKDECVHLFSLFLSLCYNSYFNVLPFLTFTLLYYLLFLLWSQFINLYFWTFTTSFTWWFSGTRIRTPIHFFTLGLGDSWLVGWLVSLCDEAMDRCGCASFIYIQMRWMVRVIYRK